MGVPRRGLEGQLPLPLLPKRKIEWGEARTFVVLAKY
jgi:hypothetical protein